MKTFKQFVAESDICKICEADPCICDDSHGFVAEDGLVAVNNVGGGSIAGVGIGPNGQPPGRMGIMNKMTRRKKSNVDSKLSS